MSIDNSYNNGTMNMDNVLDNDLLRIATDNMPAWNVHFKTHIRLSAPTLVEKVARAHALASVIRGIPIPPYLQERLDSLNIVRAVRGTTGIEGTELSEEEVERVLQASEGEPTLQPSRAREEQEVRNAAELMFHVDDLLRNNPHVPITEDLIMRFHKIITKDIEYLHNEPGKYRSFPVHAGTYIPPKTGDEILTLMSQFIDWFNTAPRSNWDPIVRAIVAHFYLNSIHPFGDGNGRSARAVESYLLYQAGVNARGFYSLANFYYRNRGKYVELLDYVRFQTEGDLTPFIDFALTGLVEELELVHSEVINQVRAVSFRDMARETLLIEGKLGKPAGERMFTLLVSLTAGPVPLKVLRTGNHALSGLYAGLTNKTLSRDIHFLSKHKLIEIIDGDLTANVGLMTQFTPSNRYRISPSSYLPQ